MVLPGLRLRAVSIHMKPGGRGKGGGGRSCTGAAAYRSATRLRDEYLEREFDFRGKGGVLHVGLVGWPVGEGESYAAAQQRLWAEVDRSERRSDARTFWDLRFTLPREFTAEQQVAVCRDIAAAIRRRYGIAIDWALHESHRLRRAGYVRHSASNPHAHMGLTTREVDDAGKFRVAKQTRLYAKRALLWIRRAIARIQNEHLRRLGHEVRVTHRSLAAEYRKLNRGRIAEGLLPLEIPEATRHRGPRASHRIRRQQACRIEEENSRIRARNGTVLQFNAKVVALDEHIRLEREQEHAAAAVPPVLDASSAESVAPPASAETLAPHTGTRPSPARGGLPVEEGGEPFDVADVEPGTQAAFLPEGATGLSFGELRQVAEGRVLELKGQLRRDEENRRVERLHRARVEDLTRLHFPDRSAEMLRAAESPEHWSRLVSQVRELAAEKPGFGERLMMRLDGGTRQLWEQRARELEELAGALEAMWRVRQVVLPGEERTGVERELRNVMERLGALNVAEKKHARSQLPGRDLSEQDQTGPGLPSGGSSHAGWGGVSR